jgi:hypothetical protein
MVFSLKITKGKPSCPILFWKKIPKEDVSMDAAIKESNMMGNKKTISRKLKILSKLFFFQS